MYTLFAIYTTHTYIQVNIITVEWKIFLSFESLADKMGSVRTTLLSRRQVIVIVRGEASHAGGDSQLNAIT